MSLAIVANVLWVIACFLAVKAEWRRLATLLMAPSLLVPAYLVYKGYDLYNRAPTLLCGPNPRLADCRLTCWRRGGAAAAFVPALAAAALTPPAASIRVRRVHHADGQV